MSEGVKILDAGAKLLLSGTDAEEIRSVLHDFIRRGAKVVSPPTQLGGKWIAACTHPVRSDGGPCKVEELGFKRIVTGPSRSLVRLKAEELVEMGATMIGDVEDVDGVWTALCDTAGPQNTGFRW